MAEEMKPPKSDVPERMRVETVKVFQAGRCIGGLTRLMTMSTDLRDLHRIRYHFDSAEFLDSSELNTSWSKILRNLL